MARESKALAIAVFGARGTGKTAWTIQQLERIQPRRLLVWDFKHDPPLRVIGQGVTSLAELARAAMEPTFKLRYLVDHSKDVQAQFDLFCRICWEAGNLTMFVDELPEVTKANRAPPAWRRCVNVGRQYTAGGQVKTLTIIGAGQRPSECDKSFIGNCDVIHTGRLGDIADADKLARSWGMKAGELANLPDLHWREKHATSPDIKAGILSFATKTVAPKQQKPKKTPVPAKKVRSGEGVS
jgi:hypothetical protein